MAGTRKPWWPWPTRCFGRSIISSPKARRTVNRAPITTTAATLIASHAARSNCSNARGTVWCWNRLPNGEPRLTGDFLSRQRGREISVECRSASSARLGGGGAPRRANATTSATVHAFIAAPSALRIRRLPPVRHPPLEDIVVRGSEVLVRFGALSNASVEPGQPDVAMGNERADAEFTRTLGTTGQVASSRRIGRPCQILR